jgi:hypothetical protein
MSLARDYTAGDLFSELQSMDRRISGLERSHSGVAGQGPGELPYINDEGIVDLSMGSLRIRRVVYNVGNPPTEAQAEAALGSASDMGDGYLAAIHDTGGTLWLLLSDGTEWHAEALTDLA